MSQRQSSFLRAVLSSALGTAISRVLGQLRETVTAGLLGAGAHADAFLIAFTVPNAFRRFVADEGLTGALIPALAKAEADVGTEAAKALANRVFTGLMLANVVLAIAGIAGAEWLVKAFAYAFTEDAEKFALTVTMTRWLFPFLAMVSLVSLFEGLLNHRGHFFAPKVAPGLVSGGVVVCGLLLADVMSAPVWAIVLGVLVGGVCHVLVNVPFVLRLWGGVRPNFDWSEPRFRGVVRELGKVVLIGLLAQANILLLRQVAAWIGDGAMSHYWYANRLVDLAQGVIAVAIGSAMLPNLSKAVAAEDWTALRGDLARAFRLAFFLLVPASVVLMVFAEPTVAMVYRVGQYKAADIPVTAGVLRMFVPFLLAASSINLLKRVYFALEDRNTLLGIGAVGVVLTGGLGYVGGERWGVSGLSGALSTATWLQLVAYVALLRWRLGAVLPLGELLAPVAKMAAACVPLAGALWVGMSFGAWEDGPLSLQNIGVYAGSGILGGVGYGLVAWVLGLEELTTVVDKLRARIGR